MKDAYYFKHDSNSRHDPKIKSVFRKYGAAGYGFYWIIIETLREASGYKLLYDEITLESLADDMRIPAEKAKEFIDYLCSDNLKLLIKTEETGGPPYFYSMSLMLRMNHLDQIRDKRSKAGSWERD